MEWHSPKPEIKVTKQPVLRRWVVVYFDPEDPKKRKQRWPVWAYNGLHALQQFCTPEAVDTSGYEILGAELAKGGIRLGAVARAHWKTGVEMEALTAVAAAALTVHDMLKSVDRSMVIEDVRLVGKSGGAGGDYELEE